MEILSDRVRHSVILDFESGTTKGLTNTVCAEGRRYKDTSSMLLQDTERNYGYYVIDETGQRQRNKENVG
jgi:hypothetical protein